MLVRNHAQVVLLLAGKYGVGRTTTTINLASAMAESGKSVLVLDENSEPGNIADQLGFHGRHDLLDIVQQNCHPRDALQGKHGYSVLPTARAVKSLVKHNRQERRRLEGTLSEISGSVDVVLVDVAMPALMESADFRLGYQQTLARPLLKGRGRGAAGVAGLSSGFASGMTLLVVMDATVSGITESYAMIKRLALESACLQFEIVVNRVADEKASRVVFDNVARVAWRKLFVRLEYAGFIPRDDRFKRAARQGCTVSEAFPAASPAKSYRHIAHGLLQLPVCPDYPGWGMNNAVPSQAGNILLPVHPYSKKVSHAVNL